MFLFFCSCVRERRLQVRREGGGGRPTLSTGRYSETRVENAGNGSLVSGKCDSIVSYARKRQSSRMFDD